MLLDNGDGKVTFHIQHTGKPDEAVIVIRRANKGMWFKKVVLKSNGNDVTSAETKDGDDGAEMKLVAGNLGGDLKLTFGKAGFLNCWKGVHEVPVSMEMLLGKRITYTWERD